MTKTELVEKIVKQSGLKRKEVTYIIDNFLEKIKDAVKQGERVEIRGFGTFFQSIKKPRSIYSPIADKQIDVPAKTVMSFKPSKVTSEEQK